MNKYKKNCNKHLFGGNKDLNKQTFLYQKCFFHNLVGNVCSSLGPMWSLVLLITLTEASVNADYESELEIQEF